MASKHLEHSKTIKIRTACFLMAAWLGIFLTACGQSENPGKNPRETSSAKAVLLPTEGSDVRGVVNFTEVKDGVKIVAHIEGLSEGPHGFHIHEHGDCSAPDASSAGGHYNPTNKKHGCPGDEERHVGDLGNIVADENGSAHYERIDSVIRLNGEHSIIGKAVIVHEKEDDCKTDPTGDAGGRMACGVITPLPNQ